MQGLIIEQDAGVHLAIRAIVVLLGFWTAWRTGKAAAEGWSNYPVVVVYTLLLAAAMQFLHYALFEGPILSALFYSIDVVSLLIFATAGFRHRRTNQMVQNYYWLYDKTSAFSWKEKH